MGRLLDQKSLQSLAALQSLVCGRLPAQTTLHEGASG
jgi:hypothetical protein